MSAIQPQEVRPLLQSVADVVIGSLPQVLAQRRSVTWKPDGSPVTAADVFLETTIRDFLESRIPNLHFVGEESHDGSLVREGCVLALLDPIDGTENFCSGLKEWGVSLGIWDSGRHLGSLLMMPELGDKLMTGDRPERFRSRVVGFSSSYHEEIGRLMGETRESRVMGCAVYNLLNVARGAYSRFCNPKGAYAWDLLPGLMLALEQGCKIWVDGSLYHGEFLQPDRRYRVDVYC